MEKHKITVKTTVNAKSDKTWEYFTSPEHVKNWNNASLDWHTTKAENDLKVGGKFDYRMEAKDGNSGFNFTGTYTEVMPPKWLAYTMDDGRKVEVFFEEEGENTEVTTTFEAETENSLAMQEGGWQYILDNFKNYIEKSS